MMSYFALMAACRRPAVSQLGAKLQLDVEHDAGLADERRAARGYFVAGIAADESGSHFAAAEQRQFADGLRMLRGREFAAPLAVPGGVGAGVVEMRVTAGEASVLQHDDAVGAAAAALRHLGVNRVEPVFKSHCAGVPATIIVCVQSSAIGNFGAAFMTGTLPAPLAGIPSRTLEFPSPETISIVISTHYKHRSHSD